MFRTSCVHHQEDYTVQAALYGMFSMHLCKESTRLKYRAHPSSCLTASINTCRTYHTRLHVHYSLPDDEHKMFETCRRQEEMNLNINLKKYILSVKLN